MKIVSTLIILAILVGLLGKPAPIPDQEPIAHLPHVTEKVEAISVAKTTPTPAVEVKAQAAPEPQAPAVPKDCVAAMHKAFPQELWAGAQIVLNHENASFNADAIGAVNRDGSRDYGCFQVNNSAHAAWFASHDWSNADDNAAYAYRLYAERGNWTAWYAVQGILW